MDLRPGYKMTDVGVIPDDWDSRKLGQLTTLLTNGFVGTATTAYVEGDDGALYIQGYNVEPNGFNIHGIKRVSRQFHERNRKSHLEFGDLLTIQTGDIGVTARVPLDFVGANCHALIISRFDMQCSEPEFYSQYFNSGRCRGAFKEIQTGTTMKHLNCGDMRQLTLPSPPINEQRAIAGALGDVDALLGALERLIAKKRDLKQAAMQQLLTGQTRLPGFSGKWEFVELRDIGRLRGGSGFPLTRQGESSGDLPFFKVSDMNNEGNNLYMKAANHYVSEAVRKNINATAFQAGTLIFAKVGAAIFLERKRILEQISCIDNNLFGFSVFASRADIRYVHAFLLSVQFGSLVSTTALPSLNAKQIGAIQMRLPSLPEQRMIAGVLEDHEAELTALEQRLAKTRALKQGMMQELLTGRIRLVHP